MGAESVEDHLGAEPVKHVEGIEELLVLSPKTETSDISQATSKKPEDFAPGLNLGPAEVIEDEPAKPEQVIEEVVILSAKTEMSNISSVDRDDFYPGQNLRLLEGVKDHLEAEPVKPAEVLEELVVLSAKTEKIDISQATHKKPDEF